MILTNIAMALLSVSGFSPADLGPLLSWTRADVSTRSAGFFDAMADSGSLGGSLDGVASHKPVDSLQLLDVEQKHAPLTEGTRAFLHSATAGDVAFYHAGTTDYTLAIRFYLAKVTHNGRLFATFSGSPALAGLILYIQANAVRLYLGNKSGAAPIVTSAVTLTAGWHNLVLTHSGGDFTLSVDEETPLSLTPPALSVDAPETQLFVGNNASRNSPLDGFVSECVTVGTVLDSEQQAALLAYFEERWSGIPGFVEDLRASTPFDGLTLADSAVGNDVTAPSAGQVPAFVPNVDGTGRPGLEFDGIDDMLQRNTFLAGAIAEPTVIFVGKYTAASSSFDYLFDGGTGRCTFCQAVGAGALYAGVQDATGANFADGVRTVASISFAGANSETSAHSHGEAVQATANNPGTDAMNGLTVAARNIDTAHSAVVMQRMLVLNHKPPAALLDALIEELKTEYGITPL